ncbi:MAG: DUF4402 domain-containing protein [Gemmatimonadota bacterium]
MKSRGTRAGMVALAVLMTLLFAGQGHAQVLVLSEQNLEFGQLTPGTTSVVAATNVTQRATITIDGDRGRYDLTFQLPQYLESASGDRVPLTFGPTDGRITVRSTTTSFDPAAGTDFRFNPAHHEATVYLGGRAHPAVAQNAGSYTATIVIMIVQTGT